MKENIILAFRGIWNHKLRSFLTMLGIIIGIASIITIVSTIKGTNDQIKKNIIGSGTNIVHVRLNAVEGYLDLDYGEVPEGILPIADETRDALNELDGVKATSLYRTRSWADNVFYRNNVYSGAIYGIDDRYLDVCGYQVNYGRGFTAMEHTERRKSALVDTAAMKTLFEGKDPIGSVIEIKGEPFTVVGVVSRSADTQVSIQSLSDYYMYAENNMGEIFIPSECWPILYQYDVPQTVAVRASSTDEMTAAGKAVADSLNETQILDKAYQYEAEDLLEQAANLQELASETNRQLIWIAGISLLVGGIGVMNIMLVSVTERTREIGLKKAIGARRKRILWQFLTEAAVLTSLGGLLGVATGIGLAKAFSSVMGTAVSISVPACVIAVVFSMVIGIVFGLIPAVKASRLNPIDALRRE